MAVDLITYKKWTLRVDCEATLKAYTEIPIGGAAKCGCIYCRNFIAARESVYPDEFLALLEQLGVDYRKEIEVWEASPEGSHLRFYSGWFHFIGEIVSVDESEPHHITLKQTNIQLTGEEEPIGDSFALSFTDQKNLTHTSFEGHSIVQLNFSADVPWVLDEMPDI